MRDNALMRSQTTPAQLNALAERRRLNAFEQEQDRRFREIQQYGRELNALERMTASLPVSDSPAQIQETLSNVIGAQFAGGAAGAVLDDPINAARNLLDPRVPSNVIPLTVYHGSPHRINNVTPDAPHGRFDMSKIGTGEGAQAYGHGIYLAESPEVARTYMASNYNTIAKNLTPGGNPNIQRTFAPSLLIDDSGNMRALKHGAETEAAGWLRRADFDRDKAKRFFAEAGDTDKWWTDKVNSAIDRIEQNTGNLYTVDLPDEHIAKMLDWDAPLSEQPEAVKAALKEKLGVLWSDRITGEQLYERIGRLGAAKGLIPLDARLGDAGSPYVRQAAGGDKLGAAVSQFLREQGIPGIRYWDGGSRAAGEGTRNFVIFDPDLVKILNRE